MNGGFGSIQDDADIEGNDEFRLSPGRAIEVDNATVHRLEASNLQPMIDTMWTIVQAVRGVSRTPGYYLRPVGGGDVPSGEALKQLERTSQACARTTVDVRPIVEDAPAMAHCWAQTFGGGVPTSTR